TLIESWNGTSWSIVASPNNGTTRANFLLGVSCVSAGTCTAAGSYINSHGVERTLIESWNGTAWSIAASPNKGTSHNRLYAVSCPSTTACMAVGLHVNGGGVDRTLVE